MMPLDEQTKPNKNVQEQQIYVQNMHIKKILSHLTWFCYVLVLMQSTIDVSFVRADKKIKTREYLVLDLYQTHKLSKMQERQVWCMKIDRSHLSLQSVMRIVYIFVCCLNEFILTHCKNFEAIWTKMKHTVSESYADSSEVCSN